MSSINITKRVDDELEEQLYLLEVIVDSLDVVKEGILETFQEKPEPVTEQTAQSVGTKKSKQGPVRVLVKFLDFPTIEIQEKEFRENEGKGTEVSKGDVKTETSNKSVPNEPSKTTSQGLQEQSSKEVKENEPVYKNQKADGASGKLPEETLGTLHPGNKFMSGKSCLFPMIPKEMMDVVRKHPIEVQVHRDAAYGEPAHLIGKARLNLGQDFIDAIALANTPTVLPVSAFIEDEYELTNVFGDVTGSVNLLIRLSCFGATIFTQFRHIQGEKGFKFSTSEGVMKPKPGVGGPTKKEEFRTDLEQFDERLPYFTGEDNLGMYPCPDFPDEKFKIPVPWRKLHEESVTPKICGPKKLFREAASQRVKEKCPMMYDFDQMFPSVAQLGMNLHPGRSMYPGQPITSGNIFEGAVCRGQNVPPSIHVPPEFGTALPNEVARLLPGQQGRGKGILDIPPGIKFPFQFGANWVTEAESCSCSNKRNKKQGGCCMEQSQYITCPNIPNAQYDGGRNMGPSQYGSNWILDEGGVPPSYICSNSQMDKTPDYPAVEQAPPHLRSSMPTAAEPGSSKTVNVSNNVQGTILGNWSDIRYIPCPNSPETRSGRNVLCGLGALADPNQRTLQNLLQPTLMAPRCPPDSTRNMPSLCTCPKVPIVVPEPVPRGVLRCECSNILTTLKPIDMPYMCPPPETRSAQQPGAQQSSCPPCPPVPINLSTPPAPECPLAKLLKEAENDAKPIPSKKTPNKPDSPGATEQPLAFSPNKIDNEFSADRQFYAEGVKNATFVPSDMNQKVGTEDSQPDGKHSKVKDKVNKILQEEVAANTTTTSYATDTPRKAEVDDKTSKTTSLTSESPPPSRRRKAKKAGKSKEVLSTTMQESREKEMNISYTPTAGIYPGMVIGHKNCVPIVRLVPKRMGWLWNIKDVDGFMKPGRGWRPGSIQTNVMKVMDNVKTNTNKQSKDKKSVKTARSGEHHTRKVESARLLATGGGDAPMFLPIDQTPTLHLHKKHGQYFLSMCPPKEPKLRGKRPKKRMNSAGEMVDESASDDSLPAQFRIDPKNPDGLVDPNLELYETDESSSISDDSYQMEVVAPSTMRNRQPQPVKVDIDIQVTENDFAQGSPDAKHGDKNRKSLQSKKSQTSQKSKHGKKKKFGSRASKAK